MSDEAFARRFYSDRAELTGLGVPLHSQRDEFTGEELYTLRSENYFLDRLDLKDDELAALQTALFYLDGKFAYAEPLRLALQNLALGRPGFDEARTDTEERVRVSAPDYSAELAGRLSKLEAAISKQRTIKFSYWSPQRDKVSGAHPQPVRAPARRGHLVRRRPGPRPRRRAHVPGLPHPQRHPLRHAPRARLPAAARVRRRGAPRAAPLADRRERRHGPDRRAGRHRLVGAPHARRRGLARRTASSRRPSLAIEPLAGWVLRQNGRAIPLEPKALRDAVADGLARLREGHDGESPVPRPRAPRRGAERSRRPPRRPDRSRALRRSPGAPRARPLRLRRGPRRTTRRRRPRGAILDPARGAAGDALAAQPRQLRRRLLHGLRGGRRGGGHRPGRQGAVRRRLPEAAEADAARGARDQPRDRLRRPDDRGGGAHAARPGAARSSRRRSASSTFPRR